MEVKSEIPVVGKRRGTLSVVIPCFNEEARLSGTINEIHAFLRRQDYDSEIIVVDDGSRDGTHDQALRLAQDLVHLRVLRFPRNHGKGFATRRGILASRGDAVLFCDADLSTPIAEIDRLWPWYDRGYPVVIGSRRAEGDDVRVRQPLHRTLVGRVFNGALAMLGIRGFLDTQCGFKLFRRDVAERIFSRLRTTGFAFDVEALLKARSLSARIAEVAVHWSDSPGSHVRPIRDGCRMLMEVLRIQRILL